MKAYIYACYAHEKVGEIKELMSAEETAALIRNHPKHLDACQIQGCQEPRDRVVIVTLEPKAKAKAKA